MKKINKTMKKTHGLSGMDIGVRFLLFRKAIKKTVPQIASELKASSGEITAIEDGTAYPRVNYLHYLHRKYGLNINWLLCNLGDMFIEESPPGLDLDLNYVMTTLSPEDGDLKAKYRELMQLMQIPVIEEAMMAKLKEIKNCLKEEE
jgi:transcriptional regulator with XRE-family HTH domain